MSKPGSSAWLRLLRPHRGSPRHALQGKAPCCRARVTSPWSQTRTFCLNLRFYLKKSIIVFLACTDGSLTARSVWRPSWGDRAALFCAFPYDQWITATGSRICEHNIACLTQSFMIGFSQLFAWVLPDKTDASCYGEKFMALGERIWTTKGSTWMCYLFPQWELFPSELCRWDSIARWSGDGVTKGAPSATSHAFGLPSPPHEEVRYWSSTAGRRRTADGSPATDAVTTGCRLRLSQCRAPRELRLIKMMSQHGSFLLCLSFHMPARMT